MILDYHVVSLFHYSIFDLLRDPHLWNGEILKKIKSF